MMLKLVVLYTVTVVAILLIYEVESNSQREVDIDSIIKLLEHQNHNYLQQKPNYVTSDGSTSVEVRLTDNEDNSHYGSLTSKEIVTLIQQATRDKNNNDKRNINRKDKLNSISNRPMHQSHLNKNSYQFKEKTQPANYVEEANTIDQLLSYFTAQRHPRQNNRHRKRRYPNKIGKGFNENQMRNKVVDNFDDYSKVYIILNPLAIEKSKSKDSLSNLITKVLSLSNQNERDHGWKEQYYKGFPVKNDLFSRRSRRDSRESFGAKDSMEDSYKQKRSRIDHAGGGGGGGGGRTAIPYIRHRGDIYERDN